MVRCSAFSLIELLVVIAILGILASVAVPAYKNYAIKSKVANSYSFMKHVQDQLITKYETSGTLANQVALGTITLNNGTYTNVTSIPQAQASGLLYFKICNDGIACANNIPIGVWLQLDLRYQDIGLPAPTTAYYLRSIVMFDKTSAAGSRIFKSFCGTWNSAGQEVPTEYLPSVCTCTNLNIIWNTGAANNPC